MWNTKEFVFPGDAPTFGSACFQYATTTVWYPAGNDTWTNVVGQNFSGTLTWKPMCDGNHPWADPVNIEATCEVGSYMTMTCTACGFITYSPKNDDALGHDYQYSHYEGGCGESSYDTVTCSRCDYEVIENRVWNDHNYVTTQVEATCTEGGYSVDTCSICGDTYQWNWTSALGHSVENWSEPTEATCTEPSTRTGACVRCGETATEEVSPALGHEWDQENGVENADGTTTYPCIRCDATYTTEGAYLYLGDNTFTIDANSGGRTKTFTAESDGTLTITMNQMTYHNAWAWENGWSDEYWQPLGIKWVFDEGFFNVYVNGSNTAYTGNGEHEIIFNSIEVKAGDVVEVEINHQEYSDYHNNDVQLNVNLALEGTEPEPTPENPALILGDNTIDLPNSSTGEGPLCTWTADADGVLTVSLASIVYHDELRYPIFGQYWMDVPVHSALQYGYFTFEVNGTATDYDGIAIVEVKTGDVVTVKVGNAYSHLAQAVVNLSVEQAHEHSYEAVVTAPTCTEGGYTTYTCECGDSYVADETPALGHSEGEAVHENEVAATCTEDGSYESVVYCTVCGVEISRETVTVDALGHDYQVKEIVPPTCTKSGYTVYECSRCSKTYKDDPVEPEHQFDEGTVTAPTCTEMGYTTYTCLICGLEYVDEASWTPALGHDFVNGECSRCDAVKEAPFTDVPVGEFYFDPVEWAVAEGITTGASETTFNPGDNCLRGHVVTFLWRAAGSPEPTSNENPFTDVTENDFFYKAVLWAVENEITNGISATEFGPYTECNRAQVVTFLWRAQGKPAVTETDHPFTDVDADQFYYQPMLWAVENGITNGLTATTFGPGAVCNRAQVVTFLYRAMA